MFEFQNLINGNGMFVSPLMQAYAPNKMQCSTGFKRFPAGGTVFLVHEINLLAEKNNAVYTRK